ncbi:hypothetical protein THAOC_01453 [Thalassiosira oceanica]|uniref:RING-type domain-containing protein n=1 Tax=Thalassiosira oceanica TaxID=159749 RepID=K0TDK8_THAOC|nr:hypothetical protein THAOC_01453 [Thalassiosira oceanica]|eukprot:EJK76768.1 hypothetical protein THAOC_01453 [Thalassiosira oceanica]
MSTTNVPGADDSVEACANRGKSENEEGSGACKKRAVELKDECLYTQGQERPEGDFCPLCTLPIPLPVEKHSVFNVCCMKKICNGCDMAACEKGMSDCPFCRTPLPASSAEDDSLAMIQARVDKKDPDAIFLLGKTYYHGALGLQKVMRKGIELYAEAAQLGSIDALYSLGNVYFLGRGAQENQAKGLKFWTKAAMQGHVESRHNLGCYEINEKGSSERAAKHFLISAKMGHIGSVEEIKDMFMRGVATKGQYAEALRGYQDAVEEMESRDRDEAKAFLESECVVPVKEIKRKRKKGKKNRRK